MTAQTWREMEHVLRDEPIRVAVPRTVLERAIAYLDTLPHLYELTARDVWPFGATQDGMAAALNLGRAHVALETKRALVAGRLERALVHVQGGRTRRFAYRPVRPGMAPLDPTEGHSRAVPVKCPHCGGDIAVSIRRV